MLPTLSLIELCVSCQDLKKVLHWLNKQNKELSVRGHSISHLTEFTRAISREQMIRYAWHYLEGQHVTMEVRRNSKWSWLTNVLRKFCLLEQTEKYTNQ